MKQFIWITALWLTGYGCNTRQQPVTTDAVKPFPTLKCSLDSANVCNDYPANIQGVQNTEIHPKIDGYIAEIAVDEGDEVKKGQLLFKIYAPQYEENLRNAAANVNIAAADMASAQMEVNKVKPLVEKDIISAYELEAAQYTLKAKQAALAQANANLSNARINLAYTSIYSPSDGVIGLLPYKMGSLVSSTSAALTTVSDISRVYAYFSFDERHSLNFFQSAAGNTVQQKLRTLPPVSLVLANGFVLPKQGRVETASGLVNAQTGAVNMRASFDNPALMVHSGSSALVRIPEVLHNVIIIPQQATYQVQGRTFVYVVNAQQQVNSVEIQVKSGASGTYIVTDGLHAGDTIVTDGISSLREGMQIKPVPATVTRNTLAQL